MAPGVSAPTRRNRVRFVDQEQGTGGTSQIAERIVEARLRQDHAGIGHHGFGDDAGDIAERQRGAERFHVVELDDAGAVRQIPEFPARPDLFTALPVSSSLTKVSSTAP